jgi:hypothetical protein
MWMRANIAFNRGDEILSEASLASLKVSLSDFIDQSQYLNPTALNNGQESLEQMRNNLPALKRNQLDALFNMNPPGGIVSLAATNAFTDDERENGYKYKVLRLYKDISRVNHSCRPNAAVSWNLKEQKVFLRAIRQIAAGNEITILYLPSEDISLLDFNRRRQELLREYNFTCACPDCNLGVPARNANDNHRTQAMNHYNAIIQSYPVFNSLQNENNLRTAKLQSAQAYVTQLQLLLVADQRLSWAYEILAEIHQALFTVAATCVRPDGNHCNGCRDNGGRRWHLDQACEAWREALVIDIRIHGHDHPEVEEDQKSMREVAAEFNKL